MTFSFFLRFLPEAIFQCPRCGANRLCPRPLQSSPGLSSTPWTHSYPWHRPGKSLNTTLNAFISPGQYGAGSLKSQTFVLNDHDFFNEVKYKPKNHYRRHTSTSCLQAQNMIISDTSTKKMWIIFSRHTAFWRCDPVWATFLIRWWFSVMTSRLTSTVFLPPLRHLKKSSSFLRHPPTSPHCKAAARRRALWQKIMRRFQ